jgi:predicted alpha/beta-fold hydrolase
VYFSQEVLMARRLQTIVALCALTISASQLLLAQPVPPPDNFFDSNGVRIRYVDQGQGAPVVLIHGYTGNLERHWVAPGVFANLAKDHRVIALDCRGHGKSGTAPRWVRTSSGSSIT